MKICVMMTVKLFKYDPNPSVALVCEQTVLTERPPLVGEVSANFCRYRVLHGQRNRSRKNYEVIYNSNIRCKICNYM
jgi:hypothetical protein